METISQIQTLIFEKLNLKTSVKKGTGSMKGYFKIMPIFQNGEYPNMEFNFIQELKQTLKQYDYQEKPLFCTTSEINIYGIEDDRLQYKKEKKPKASEGDGKGWGSKNSQLRLDKATSRYAKRLKKGGCARYY